MPKVILVNPSLSTAGYSFITPRWLFVIAQSTPVELVGDPVLVDESIEKFNPGMISPGDIVGIGISSGNCIPGYRVLREAKSRGATVIMGGIHATIFPEEPLRMGADAVVTGSGEAVWSKAVRDALEHQLQRQYAGGRVSGEAMVKARWDMLDATKYIFPSVQTVAGCPENCSFCSVWVTEGRQPRQRLGAKVIEEVNELYDLGFRYIVFADDNFNPSTLGRIARESSESKRREFERIRDERLKFFDEYDRAVPKDMFAFAQMTSEVITDEEYLDALYRKMRIRTALIGVESFSEEGLKSAGKLWNPVGDKMVAAIQKIQATGIMVLSSIICGLESDTVDTIRTMRKFANESGTLFAQFTVYNPYPGTKDFYEMMDDKKHLGQTRLPSQAQDPDPRRGILAPAAQTVRHRGASQHQQERIATREQKVLGQFLLAQGKPEPDQTRESQAMAGGRQDCIFADVCAIQASLRRVRYGGRQRSPEGERNGHQDAAQDHRNCL